MTRQNKAAPRLSPGAVFFLSSFLQSFQKSDKSVGYDPVPVVVRVKTVWHEPFADCLYLRLKAAY